MTDRRCTVSNFSSYLLSTRRWHHVNGIRRRVRLATMTALYVSVLTSIGCGLGEAHFQSAWKGEVLLARAAIQDFWDQHKRLPSSLEYVEITTPSGYGVLVQYRKESAEVYRLWIRRVDIGRFDDNPGAFLPTPGEPESGDVLGSFHVDGRILSASWRSIWS
jgi:hypothetical protein